MNSRERRAQEHRELLERWEKSGLSLRAFGLQESVPYTRLMYWRRRLREDDAPSRERLSFVELEFSGTESAESGSYGEYELLLPNGVSVRVGSGFDATEVRELVTIARGVER